MLEAKIYQLRTSSPPNPLDQDPKTIESEMLSAPSELSKGAPLDLVETLDVTRIDRNFREIVDNGYIAAHSVANLEMLFGWFRELDQLDTHERGNPNGVARHLVAKSIALEIHTLLESLKAIGRLAEKGAPRVQQIASKLEERHPDIRRLRNSISHSRERIEREGGKHGQSIEGRLQIGVLNNRKLTYTDASGNATIDLTETLLNDVVDCFYQVFEELPTLEN